VNVRILAGALGLALLANCNGAKKETIEIPTVAVERRDIVLDATASGTVEPINVVEVKSKSSGQITRMTVETGSIVNRGDLQLFDRSSLLGSEHAAVARLNELAQTNPRLGDTLQVVPAFELAA